MEPPPDRAAGDVSNQTGIANLAGNIGSVPAGNGDAMRVPLPRMSYARVFINPTIREFIYESDD